MYTTPYELVRLKLYSDKSATVFNLTEKQFQQSKIVCTESELVRIICTLNPENSKKDKSQYPFIKDLLVLKVGKAVTAYNGLTDTQGKIILNIIEKDLQGKDRILSTTTFKRLMCGSGAQRSKKVFFVNELYFDKVDEILRCGVLPNATFKSLAKFSSYYALPTSDSIPVSMPRIVVIKDFEHIINERFDIVNHNKVNDTWVVENDSAHDFKILPFDGAGLISVAFAQKWAKELRLNYTPSAFQFRCIPAIKGCLFTFDIFGFAKEHGKSKIVDLWGKSWDIITDKIDCIMTESQFKFKDKFKSLDEWHSEFLKPCYGYTRTFNISEHSEKYKYLKQTAYTSYQHLQTLDLSNEEIEKLCNDTILKINGLHTNLDLFLTYRSLVDASDGDKSKKKMDRVPPYYQALKNCKGLWRDSFINERIKNDLKSLRWRSYIGKLIIDGNYKFFAPDVYALAQWAFGIEVTGLLPAKTIYDRFGLNRKVKEVDIIRNPHISCEHFVVSVNQNEDMKKWFHYQNAVVVTSIHDSLAQRLNSADYDGDHVLSTSNKVIIDAVKKANPNTIIAIETSDEFDNTAAPLLQINNIEELIQSDVRGMGNEIGPVINQITKLWQCKQTPIVGDYIKIMSIVGSLTIDYIKTGIKTEIPKEITAFLKKEKMPYFIKYKDSEAIADENTVLKVGETLSVSDEVIEENISYQNSDCTMNRVCNYMESQVESLPVDFKDVTDCPASDMLLLLSGQNTYLHNDTYPKVKKLLTVLQAEHDKITEIYVKSKRNGTEESLDDVNKYWQFYSYCRFQLLEVCRGDVNKAIDYIIMLCETDADFKLLHRYILWNAFGKEMIKRSCGDFAVKEYDYDKLLQQSEKSKLKAKEAIAKKDKANLGRFCGVLDAKTGKMKYCSASIMMKEIVFIRKSLRGKRNEQRLLFVLLALYRMNKDKPITISPNSKTGLNVSQIRKVLNWSRPDLFNDALKELIQSGFITATSEKLRSIQVSVLIPRFYGNENDIVISDANKDCKAIISEFFR